MDQLSPESSLLYLSRADIASLGVSSRELFGPLRSALAEKGTGAGVQNPPKAGVQPREDSSVHAASAYCASSDLAGVKWVSRYPHNPELQGRPACDGLFVLNGGATGAPIAVLDASLITDVRTAVASAIALTAVRPHGLDEVVLLGFGAQGQSHLQVLPELLPGLTRLRIHSRRPDRVRALVESGRTPGGVDVVVVETAEQALADAVAVVSAIPMLRPPPLPYDASLLPAHAVIVAIDFDAAWQPSIFDRTAAFVVDDVPQYHRYVEQGWFEPYPRDPVDLSDVLRGEASVPPDDFVYVNALGLGIEDVVTAGIVVDRARHQGVGQYLER